MKTPQNIRIVDGACRYSLDRTVKYVRHTMALYEALYINSNNSNNNTLNEKIKIQL